MTLGNILVSSDFGSRSHVLFILEISKVLLDRGYQIGLATTEENLKYAKGYNVSLVNLGSYPDYHVDLQHTNDAAFLPSKKLDTFSIMNQFHTKTFPGFYEVSFAGFKRYFEYSGKPDLLICDVFALACIDVAHKYDIPLVIASQAADYVIGLDSPLLSKGCDLGPSTADQIGLWEKTYHNLIVPRLQKSAIANLMKRINSVRAQFDVTGVYSFVDLNNALVLLDSSYGFFPPVDLPSWTRFIGPILPESHSPLDSKTAGFLSARKSVMYISFGSELRIAPFDIEHILLASLKAFDSGDLDGIVWSLGILKHHQFPSTLNYQNKLYKTTDLLELYKHKIHFVKWTSQMEVLRHKSTRIFLTHGGMTSIHESFLASKPTLCYPFTADQPRNAYRLYEIGVGLFVDRYQTNYLKLSQQIQTLIQDENKTFSANVERMRAVTQLNNPAQQHDKKVYAANLIEGHLQTAQACRPILGPGCETLHIAPVSRKMSYLAAHDLDLLLIQCGFYLLLIVTGLILVKSIVSRIIFHSQAKPKIKTKSS